MKPVEIEFLIKNGTAATLEKINADLNKVGRDGATSVNAANMALEDAQKQVLLLTGVVERLERELEKLSTTPPNIDQSKNLAQIEQLQNKITELQQQIKQLEEVSKNTSIAPPGLPVAKRQFDGLNFSIQQLAREMPTLAMGPSIFFSAISNNLPIFTDEVARARKEYDATVKAGEKGIPVGKQILSAAMSWQTLIPVVSFLLVAFADDIGKAISSMFGFSTEKQRMNEMMEKGIEIDKEANKTASATRTELLSTMNTIKSFNGTKEQEGKLIEELNDKYSSSFGYYDTLSQWYDTLTAKAEAYTRVMFLQSKQQALLAQATEVDAELQITKNANAADVEGGANWLQEALLYNASARSGVDATAEINKINEANKATQIESLRTQRNAILKEIEALHTQELETINKNNLEQEAALGSIDYLESALEKRRVALDRAVDDATRSKLRTEIADLESQIATMRGNAGGGSNATTSSTIDVEDDVLSQMASNDQSRINLMAEGSAKRVAQIKLNYDNEIAEIEKQEKRWREAQKGELTADQTTVLDTSRALADNKKKQAETELQNEEIVRNEKFLEKYKTFTERYAQLKADFESDSIAIVNAGGSTANVAVREGQYEQDVEALNQEVLNGIDGFEELAQQLTDANVKKIIELLEAEKRASGKAGKELGDAEIQAIDAQIAKLQSATENTSPAARSVKDWQDLQIVLGDSISLFEQLGGSIGGATGEIIDAAGVIASSTITIIGSIQTLSDSSAEAMEASAAAGKDSITAVEKASVILSIIGAVINVVTKLYNLINGNKQEALQEEIDMYNELVATYDTLIDKQKELLQNSTEAKALAEYNEALDMVQAKQDAAAASLRTWFSSGAGWFSRSEGYKYNEDFSNILSQDDLFAMSADQWEAWMISNAETWARLPEEVRNYANAIMDSSVQTDELQTAWEEFMTGFSLDDARNSLRDFLDDFDSDGKTAAENFGSYLSTAINNVVANNLDAELVSWYEGLADAMSDGITTAERDALQAQYEQIMSDALEQRNAAYDVIGFTPESAGVTQSGQTGAFETMTVDQGNKLEGLFTSNEMRTARIEEHVESVSYQMSMAVGFLEKIEENTGRSSAFLEEIKAEIKKMVQDGIKIKSR